MENISPSLEKKLSKIFIYSQRFSKLKHLIFTANLLQVLQGMKLKASNVIEAIKINDLKLVLKNPHNLLLGQARKIKSNVFNFYENLSYNIIFFDYCFFKNIAEAKVEVTKAEVVLAIIQVFYSFFISFFLNLTLVLLVANLYWSFC